MTDITDATVGGVSANSYITQPEASEYIEHHINSVVSDVWEGANSDLRRISVQMATRLLDQWVDWKGYRQSEAQALRWPRVGAYDKDGYLLGSDVIPKDIKTATSELTRILIVSGDVTADPDTLGYTEMKVEGLALKIDKDDRDRYGSIPDSVRVIIESYGTIRSKNAPSFVKLLRT